MAISVEEYLKDTSKPYLEYIDGVVRRKSWPDGLHARAQFRAIELLWSQGVEALPEVTVQLSPTKFFVPDVIADPIVENPYPTKPVQLCVEVLSRDEHIGAFLAKCEEYHAWGVPHCWVIDPVKQTGWEYNAQCDPSKVDIDGTLRAGHLAVRLADLFAPKSL